MPFKKLCCCAFHSERGHGDARINDFFKQITRRRSSIVYADLLVPDTKNENQRFAAFAATEFSSKGDAKHWRYAVLIY